MRERARVYERWLTRETLRAETAAQQNALSPVSLEGYAIRASEEIEDGARRFLPFAPYQAAYSALRTFTRGQLVALAALALALIIALALDGALTLTLILGALTGFYLLDLAITATISTRTLQRKTTVVIEDAVARAVRDGFWPSYTILCPLYHEAGVAEQFVRAMRLLDYPTDRLQVLFLTEEDDLETREALLGMRLPEHFEVVTVPDGSPRTKPRACNYGLLRATGDFVVIFDAEDIPDPLQLKKAVLTFAHFGPELACVQASLNFYNPRQNLLTRWFTAEYSLWFDLTLPALQRMRSFLPLGGTSNHFRARVLREVGGWDPFNVTEDCDLGVRLAQYNYQTAMADSTTYEEANPDLKNWLRQRSRWIKGYMQTYLTHMRDPKRYIREGRLGELFWLQVIVGGRTFTQLVNPVLWLMTLAYVVFHQALTAPYHILYPGVMLYAAAFCLFFGNLFYIYTYLIGCLNRRQYTLTLWSLLIPFYWALMSVAAYIALYQLLTRPHYWEKTRHGLSHLPATPGWTDAALPLGELAPALAVARTLGDDVAKLPEALARTLAGNAWLRGLAADLARGPLRGASEYLRDEITRGRRAARLDYERDAQVAPSLALPVAPVVDMFSTVTMAAIRPAFMTLPSLPAIRAVRSPGLSLLSNPSLPVVAVAPPGVVAPRMIAPGEGTRAEGAQTAERVSPTPRWRAWMVDRWLVATLLTAIVASVTACIYFFSIHALVLDDDASNHMRLARSVFDSVTPGLAQIGTVWLPLPDALLWPFVWNDFLWRTGLAGAFAAMPCFVIASIYLYLIAREISDNRVASFVGALAFILNPNILYLQTTALTEPAMLALMTATGYYFLRWVKTDTTQSLLVTAFCVFLTTLTRYEGWSFFLAMTLLMVVIGVIKRLGLRRILGEVVTFVTLGGFGIGAWLLWNLLLTGNPLYFQNGMYSPKAQQTHFLQANTLPTYHNLPQTLLSYGVDLLEFAGPVIIALALVALALYGWRSWRSAVSVALLVFLSPFPLHLLALYSGQTVLYVPQGVPDWIHDPYFNTRYSTALIIPVSIFIATMIPRLRLPQMLIGSLVGALIIAQLVILSTGGVITLQEAQRGLACLPLLPAESYLIQHYNGGRILVDTTANFQINFGEANIHLSNVIYVGSNGVWQAALAHPADYADWIIATPGDAIYTAITSQGTAFTDRYILVQIDSTGREVFYKRGLPPLPTRVAPTQLLAEHAACNAQYGVSPFPAPTNAAPSTSPQQGGPHASIISPALTALLVPSHPAISLLEGAHA